MVSFALKAVFSIIGDRFFLLVGVYMVCSFLSFDFQLFYVFMLFMYFRNSTELNRVV